MFALRLVALSTLASQVICFSGAPPFKIRVASAHSATELNMKAEAGKIVTVECSLIPEGDFVPEPLFDGLILDGTDTKQKLAFVLGQGNYLPGLHELLTGKEEGYEIDGASIDAGWGAWNPALKVPISFESLGGIDSSAIKVGVELLMGNGLKAVVTEVGEDEFVVDANPPLAGASYLASLKLLSIENGPSEFSYTSGDAKDSDYQVATVALGCFWGAELAYMREPGVVGTKVGYTQGEKEDPAYREVCSGETGHTEAVMVAYDPRVVSYEALVSLAMDRLGENKYLLNQVGNDKGTQYRHGVYYHDNEQKAIAEEVVGSFGDDCQTEVLPAATFYDAEDYHMQYLLKGGQSARKGESSTIRCYG